MRILLLFLSMLVVVPAWAQRNCGQATNDQAERVILSVGCWERDVNQALNDISVLQNLAYVGIMVGFTGVAYNINARNTEHYHLWQFIGQSSASYLLYTINDSRGGLLEALGMTWAANAVFQAIINGVVIPECKGNPCWSDREPDAWDLESIAMPNLFPGKARVVQFGLGAGLVGLGLLLDLESTLWPLEVGPNSVKITF